MLGGELGVGLLYYVVLLDWLIRFGFGFDCLLLCFKCFALFLGYWVLLYFDYVWIYCTNLVIGFNSKGCFRMLYVFSYY